MRLHRRFEKNSALRHARPPRAVLLGPLRAVTYVCMHGLLAGALGSLWARGSPAHSNAPAGSGGRRASAAWWLGVLAAALVRMGGQFAYLLFSSLTLNENLFAIMLSNVHGLLDQIGAATGSPGAAAPATVVSLILAILLVNGACGRRRWWWMGAGGFGLSAPLARTQIPTHPCQP